MKYVTCLVRLDFLQPIGSRRRIITRKPGRMGHVRTYERLGAWEAYKFGPAAPRRYQETLNPKYVPPPSPSPLLKKSEGAGSQKIMCVLCGGRVGGDSSKDGEASIDASRRREEKKSQRMHNSAEIVTRVRKEAKTSLVQKNRSFSGDTEVSQENDAESRDCTRVHNGVVWIVDWDIPLTKNRFRFYRALRKLKKELGLHDPMSTKSVLVTKDEELAFRVFNLALMFTAKVHIYEAREVGTRVPIQGGFLDGRS